MHGTPTINLHSFEIFLKYKLVSQIAQESKKNWTAVALATSELRMCSVIQQYPTNALGPIAIPTEKVAASPRLKLEVFKSAVTATR